MSWLDRLFGRRRTEERALSAQQFRDMGLLDSTTTAGVTVTASTALTLPAYWSGVQLIANAIAKLPRKVYRKSESGDVEEQPKHAVAWLLQTEPNEYVTPHVFWRTLMAHVLTWGNGYAEIERDGANRPIALLTMTPDKVEPEIGPGGALRYIFDGKVRIPAVDVLHVPGLGFDGIKGYSVIEKMRQSLGLAVATERFGAAFFGNGAMPGVVLEHPGKLTPAAQKLLRDSWNVQHGGGPDRAHRTAVLEEGMTAKALSIPAKDAQLIETRQMQALDMARILNLNPTFIGHQVAERPGGNYEASRLDFLDNTLDPWLVAIEQECNRKLLSEQQRGSYYIEHVRNAILRTDAKTRSEIQKTYVGMGAMTPEYVAKLENLPKPPEPKPAPAPMPPPAPAAAAAQPDDEPADDAGVTEAQRGAWRRVIVDVLSRMVKLEGDRARAASRQGPERFESWADEFYPAHEVRLREALEPVVRGWCEMHDRVDWRGVLEGLAAELVTASRDELLAVKAAALEADVDARVARWERERPSEIAARILEAK